MNNYRGISVLPIAAKIFEHVLSIQIKKYFSSNNLFSEHQHGFRTTHLHETISDCLGNLDLDFFPYELHTAVTTKKRKKVDTDKQEIDLDKLEALEKEEVLDKSRDSLSNALAKEDGGESGDEVDEEVDEMESDMDDDNDYAIDHYDDELDALGSDGGGEDY